MHMTMNTDGRRALVAWLKADPSRSQTALAEKLGIKQPSVSAWVSGASRPGPELRPDVEALTGIPLGAWDTAKERRTKAARRERIAASS
jgi:transcriptional regulator with XRE-family HTH domain